MIKYSCYGLLGIYIILLLRQLCVYTAKKAPSGPDSMEWALGLYYTFFLGLIVIVSIALVIYDRFQISFFLLIVPVIFLISQRLHWPLYQLYAKLPSLKKIPLLQLSIVNDTNKNVHVQLNCLFERKNNNTLVTYKSLNYFLGPLETKTFSLSRHETLLLATKSKVISIALYERVLRQFEGGTYLHQVQPCFDFYYEYPKLFRTGEYCMVVSNPKKRQTIV